MHFKHGRVITQEALLKRVKEDKLPVYSFSVIHWNYGKANLNIVGAINWFRLPDKITVFPVCICWLQYQTRKVIGKMAANTVPYVLEEPVEDGCSRPLQEGEQKRQKSKLSFGVDQQPPYHIGIFHAFQVMRFIAIYKFCTKKTLNKEEGKIYLTLQV